MGAESNRLGKGDKIHSTGVAERGQGRSILVKISEIERCVLFMDPDRGAIQRRDMGSRSEGPPSSCPKISPYPRRAWKMYQVESLFGGLMCSQDTVVEVAKRCPNEPGTLVCQSGTTGRGDLRSSVQKAFCARSTKSQTTERPPNRLTERNVHLLFSSPCCGPTVVSLERKPSEESGEAGKTPVVLLPTFRTFHTNIRFLTRFVPSVLHWGWTHARRTVVYIQSPIPPRFHP
jgi:hypothetical protein